MIFWHTYCMLNIYTNVKKGSLMKFGINQLPKILVASIFVLHLNAYSQDEQQSVFEEVIVTAEKRDESLARCFSSCYSYY